LSSSGRRRGRKAREGRRKQGPRKGGRKGGREAGKDGEWAVGGRGRYRRIEERKEIESYLPYCRLPSFPHVSECLHNVPQRIHTTPSLPQQRVGQPPVPVQVKGRAGGRERGRGGGGGGGGEDADEWGLDEERGGEGGRDGRRRRGEHMTG